MPDGVCIDLARYRLEKAQRAFKSASINETDNEEDLEY